LLHLLRRKRNQVRVIMTSVIAVLVVPVLIVAMFVAILMVVTLLFHSVVVAVAFRVPVAGAVSRMFFSGLAGMRRVTALLAAGAEYEQQRSNQQAA
jgi:hypothetical protein